MSSGTVEINWINLAAGYLLLAIPVLILRYYQTGLVKDLLIGFGRMTAQLLLTGIYLETIFRLNNIWLNLAWVLLIIIITAWSTVNRTSLGFRMFFIPVLFAITVSVISIDAFFLGIVIRPGYLLDARYLVPVTGMMLGNSLQNNIIALNGYYSEINREIISYRYSLANGAARREALLPFMREALKRSFNPTIANVTSIGLIWIPGMMTGQILGGTNPMTAIKYQIMIMITIFVSGIISVVLTINSANRYVFDDYDNLKNTCFRKEKAISRMQ